MPNIIQGQIDSAAGRFAIIVSRYNESITSKLLEGALETFASHGVGDEVIDVVHVPGAWELSVVAARLARRGEHVAVVCLGAVIRGETTHDRYINRAVSTALAQVSVETEVPVLFGLLTCETLEQAIHRSGGKAGNKGAECALAALEMADLMSKLA